MKAENYLSPVDAGLFFVQQDRRSKGLSSLRELVLETCHMSESEISLLLYGDNLLYP